MKRPVLVLLSAMTLSSAALAVPAGYYIGGFGEANFTDGEKDNKARHDFIEDGKGLGLELGYFYDSRWGGRIEWANLDFDNAMGGSDVEGDRYGIDALYRLHEDGPVYGVFGLKHLEAGKGHTAANLGLGFDAMVSEKVSLFGEGTVYSGLSESFTDVGAKLGLRYHFAASKMMMAEPTPQPELQPELKSELQPEPMLVDSDSDGVMDDEDLCLDSSPKYAVDANGCVVLETYDVTIDLQIPFANNSAVVRDQYRSEVKRVADFLNDYPQGVIEIAGHTSARGDATYNLDLSSRRAQAVANILVNDYGISAERVTHKGYGETQLLDGSGTAESARVNRRIEAVFTATEQRKKLR